MIKKVSIAEIIFLQLYDKVPKYYFILADIFKLFYIIVEYYFSLLHSFKFHNTIDNPYAGEKVNRLRSHGKRIDFSQKLYIFSLGGPKHLDRLQFY